MFEMSQNIPWYLPKKPNSFGDLPSYLMIIFLSARNWTEKARGI